MPGKTKTKSKRRGKIISTPWQQFLTQHKGMGMNMKEMAAKYRGSSTGQNVEIKVTIMKCKDQRCQVERHPLHCDVVLSADATFKDLKIAISEKLSIPVAVQFTSAWELKSQYRARNEIIQWVENDSVRLSTILETCDSNVTMNVTLD